jgi:hypothetical protein
MSSPASPSLSPPRHWHADEAARLSIAPGCSHRWRRPARLFASMALGQRGRSVRLHEQAPDLRMLGAGNWRWKNGLRSLEASGVLDAAVHRGRKGYKRTAVRFFS